MINFFFIIISNGDLSVITCCFAEILERQSCCFGTFGDMGNLFMLQLICVILVSVSIVKAEDPYRYFTWTVTYGTASPLGVPQQVITINTIF